MQFINDYWITKVSSEVFFRIHCFPQSIRYCPEWLARCMNFTKDDDPNLVYMQ